MRDGVSTANKCSEVARLSLGPKEHRRPRCWEGGREPEPGEEAVNAGEQAGSHTDSWGRVSKDGFLPASDSLWLREQAPK